MNKDKIENIIFSIIKRNDIKLIKKQYIPIKIKNIELYFDKFERENVDYIYTFIIIYDILLIILNELENYKKYYDLFFKSFKKMR